MVKPYSSPQACTTGAGLALLGWLVTTFCAFVLLHDHLAFRDFVFTLLFVFLILGALFMLVGAIVLMKLARRWEHLYAKRQTVVRGHGLYVPLAAQQPAPSALGVSLDTTIRIPMKRSARITIWIGLLVCVAIYCLVSRSYWSFSQACGAVPFILSFVWAVSQWTGGFRIDVTQDGISVHVPGGVGAISWNDARLFALTRGQIHTPPTWYELASATSYVTWFWLRPGTLAARIYTPSVPYDEYNRQMETLTSIIATQTGLPLYDLR